MPPRPVVGGLHCTVTSQPSCPTSAVYSNHHNSLLRRTLSSYIQYHFHCAGPNVSLTQQYHEFHYEHMTKMTYR